MALFPIAGKLVSINLIEVLNGIIYVRQSFLSYTAQYLDFIYLD